MFSCNFSFLTYDVYICYSSAQKTKYTTITLPQDLSTLETDAWFQHPTEPIEVNEHGTHVRYNRPGNILDGKFLNIRRKSWEDTEWIDHGVSVRAKEFIFSRLVLECKLGRKLLPGETCEHIDCNRDNNRMSNLLSRYQLFQANARKCHKFQVDGKVTGVYEVKDGRYFEANVRIYTPGGRSASISFKKCFSVSKYGGRDKAWRAAVAFREQHTLQAGMCYI